MGAAEDGFTEIANAILRLRAAFKLAGMEAPKAIELANHRDGDFLRHSLPRDMLLMQPQMTDNGPAWVGNICGVDIHYPGQWRARERGGQDLV